MTDRGDTLTDSKSIYHKSVKDRVISAKIQNPKVSLKVIALNENTSHSYARNVWSEYQQKLVTLKGGSLPPLAQPFPFLVQNQGFTLDGPTYWYVDAPLAISANKNRQKVHKTPYYSIVFHARGSVQLYIYHMDWEKELRGWLSEWMSENDLIVFFDYLTDRDGKHFTVDAPGVPRGYKFTIPGVGTFATDSTPFKKGTIEFEVDPGFDKRLHAIEKAVIGQQGVLGQIANSMEIFGEGMRDHMKLISALQNVASKMSEAIEEMRKQ